MHERTTPVYFCLQVINKTKPKSKWADISKQIEQNAKTSKPASTKAAESKLPAAAGNSPIIDYHYSFACRRKR